MQTSLTEASAMVWLCVCLSALVLMSGAMCHKEELSRTRRELDGTSHQQGEVSRPQLTGKTPQQQPEVRRTQRELGKTSHQQELEGRTSIRTIIDLLFNIGRDFYEFGQPSGNNRYDCPLCDSSVYSYCSEKLLHDACCCLDRYEHNLPRQCRYADCSFLHANSCEEHRLITACCCSKQFY